MLTPKIRKTNLVKDNTGFKVGGYARSRAWGTRVYKVVAIREEAIAASLIYSDRYKSLYANKMQKVVTLMKVGETNLGRFRFSNGRPFEVEQFSTMHWYYPAKGI